MIVVDTNVVVHTILGGPHAAMGTAAFARDPEWAAPPLWRSEFANVLATQVRAGALGHAEAREALSRAEMLLAARERPADTAAVLEFAMESGCTAYDCEFVALARALGTPLVTNDRQLLKAFPGTAISLTTFATGHPIP
jgi:predicted nucleic acid-binding protein